MRIFLTLTLIVTMAASAQAHFIWLVPETDKDGKTVVQVYFAEDAESDDPDLLKRIEGLNLSQVRGDQIPQPLKVKLTDESLSAPVPNYRNRSLFIASHDLGVLDRGSKVFRLKYYAKSGPEITNNAWKNTKCSDDLKLDLVPSLKEGKISITALFEGKPVAGSQVKASGPGLEDYEGVTDKSGTAVFEMAKAGLYSIRARHIEAKSGTLDGKDYPETRHYTTIAVRVPQPLKPIAAKKLTEMETPVTSFGAALSHGRLYTYGGHTGGAHSYSKEEQGNVLRSFDLKTGQWKDEAKGPHLQGLALVAHGGKLYRIGGFTAMNAEGEDHDLRSQSSVASFDPASGSWTDLPSLPEPRSSFDAAVLGDAIYVVGGWSMQGDDEKQWHDTAWKLDLKQQPLKWQALSQAPFRRRALAVAAHDGKIYAIGGMQEEGGPTSRVSIYDPATDKWTEGPNIQGEGKMAGFGSSAFATGGRLYVSTIDGSLQRLKSDGSAWDVLGETTTARFFHRLLPFDDQHLLAVGGANMGIGKFEDVELWSVNSEEK